MKMKRKAKKRKEKKVKSRLLWRRIQWLSVMALAVVLAGGVLFAGRAFATETEGGGSMGGGASSNMGSASGSGGESGGWLRSYSWVFYKASGDAISAGGVEMPFRPDAPLAGTVTRSERNANNNIIPSECSAHENGGVWHFGLNAFGSNYVFFRGEARYHFGILSFVKGISVNAYTYSITRGTYGHAFSFDYNGRREKPMGATLGQDLYYNDMMIYSSAYYDGDEYWLYDEELKKWVKRIHDAEAEFKQAYNYYYKSEGGDYDRDGNGPFMDRNGNPVWYFCWWPGMEKNYYNKSDVSVQGGLSGSAQQASTGITKSGEKEVEIDVAVNEPTPIEFTHNIFGGIEDELGDPTWTVERQWEKDGVAYAGFWNTDGSFEVSPVEGLAFYEADANAVSTSVKYGQIFDWNPYDSEYVIGDVRGYERGYTDGSEWYALRDKVNVVFNADAANKEYKYCEILTLKDGDTQVARTKVCAKLNVKDIIGDPQYLSVSNVSNSMAVGYASTGIVPESRTPAEKDASVRVGETARVVFSHNIYSTERTYDNSVSWQLTRAVDSSLSLSSSSNYTVSAVSTTSPTSGYVKFNTPENGYYAADNRSVSYFESDAEDLFIARDVYDITFLARGTYKFCEGISVNGVFKTYSCSTITVGGGPIIREGCANWKPSSYTSSGIMSGSRMTGTTSVLSRIKNNSLTTRSSGATYAGWQSVMTYAKPGDNISWVNCYYPGAQALATEHIATNDPHPQWFTTVSTGALYLNSGVSWDNNFNVRSETTSGNRIFYLPDTATNANDNSSGATITSARSGNTYRLNVGLAIGAWQWWQTNNDYGVRLSNDAGQSYTETISTTGQPYYAQINYGNHSWPRYRCCIRTCPTTCCSKNSGCHTCYYCCQYGWCNYSHYLNRNLHGYGYASATVRTGTQSASTSVIVPYNFINSASFNVSESVVYAGDTINIQNARVDVGVRSNNVTKAVYTTQVDDAEVRLVAYVSNRDDSAYVGEQTQVDYSAASRNACDYVSGKQCMEVKKYQGGTTTLNSDGNLGGHTHSGSDLSFNGSYNVFDASAGDYMCFVMAVFPWRSGPEGSTYIASAADVTQSASGTESKWLITAPKCAQIAKKPSMQVTGGSIYTNGGIEANYSTKHNLYNITNYSLSGGATYFGSWAEGAVIANGTVTNFASGAALGRTSGGAGYGNTRNSYCKSWVPLSFANYSTSIGGMCKDGDDGDSGRVNISSNISDRAALVNYIIAAGSPTGGGGSDSFGSYNTIMNVSAGREIRDTSAESGDLTVSGSVAANVTRVVRAMSGNVWINGNITYANGDYGSMSVVPKAVIYASGNIYISCDVSRVDAILIAGGTVYTCDNLSATSGSMESARRSQNQLVINGAVIANGLEFGRTYGAAAGIYSGTAAEIVNYDTSALVWGRSMADAGESDTLTTVYQHELAPRY